MKGETMSELKIKDKDIVDRYFNELQKSELKAWYDKEEIIAGDSITSKVSEGLKDCELGIIFLSKNFLAKQSVWTEAECNYFINSRMKKNKTLILIDGNALVHRAFHALPPLTAPDGTVTNAVFGFSSILIRTIKDIKPDFIAAAFDLAGPTFRHKEYKEYKAKRVKAPQELYDQIPLVKEVLQAFGIPIFEKETFEADDLIGTISAITAKDKELKTIIATGDLDTLQLVVGEQVVVFTLKRGMRDTVIYDEPAIMERYGIKPSQMTDFKGLKGDVSDNIAGVPGIGDKTAETLIQNFGSLEDLYKKLIDLGEEIGLATVHRVLNQFDDAGIVTRHHFEGGKSVFELSTQHHHDHLVCRDCGEVIEFSDDLIEERQKEIAERYNVKLTNHSLYLYGKSITGDCKGNPDAHKAKK